MPCFLLPIYPEVNRGENNSVDHSTTIVIYSFKDLLHNLVC